MRRKLIAIILIFSLIIAKVVYSENVFFQDKKPKDAGDSDSTKTEIQKLDFNLSQYELHRLGDYDLAKWLTHLPQIWITRSPQLGQPQEFQGIGIPIWMSGISWNGMQLDDPIYGHFDINFLPVVSIDTLRLTRFNSISINPFSLVEINDEKITTNRPYSQVFYNAGGNDLKNVDILFKRGFSRGIKFKSGANFFRYGGIYFNSEFDSFKLHSEISIPFSNKVKLKYQFLSNRIESGYPGTIDQNYYVQFSRLHRKVLRQDHGIDLDYHYSDKWQGKMQLQFHQDQSEYTDWKLPWHSIDNSRWLNLSTQIIKKTTLSNTTFNATAQAVYASRLEEKKLEEFPLRLSIKHHQKTILNSEINARIGYSYYDSHWQGSFGEIEVSKNINENLSFTSSGYYMQEVSPFGWRNGRILPFENQPWPIHFTGSDFNFYSESRPEDPVILSGISLKMSWRPSAKINLYSDFQIQQVKNLAYPQTGTSGNIEFINISKYHSTGLYLNVTFLITDWLIFTGRYQNSLFSSQELINTIEIPNHWIFTQLHATRFFFQKNLKANILLFGEFLSDRNSYNLSTSSSLLFSDYLKAVPLFHMKLIFEIGDAEIFLNWNNLSDQFYYYRSQQPIPGLQFQYGVIWRFWD